jgi:A/G-specific adenine glycosylase
MNRVCAARREGKPEAYPVADPKRAVPHKIVGAGVLRNGKGQVLIAQRREKAMLGGLWEFPGGTLEAGESVPECIARELKEELGVETEIGGLLLVVHHAYSHFTIDLHVHEGRITRGRPRAIECADWAWVRLNQLNDYPFSRADLHVVSHLMKAEHASAL